MRKTIYQQIYKKLEQLGALDVKDYKKIENPHYYESDLEINRLSNDVIALSQTYEKNGDLVPNPHVTIRISIETLTAETLTYRDACDFRKVYPEPGKVNIHAKKELNEFLTCWLTNLIKQIKGAKK